MSSTNAISCPEDSLQIANLKILHKQSFEAGTTDSY